MLTVVYIWKKTTRDAGDIPKGRVGLVIPFLHNLQVRGLYAMEFAAGGRMKTRLVRIKDTEDPDDREVRRAFKALEDYNDKEWLRNNKKEGK